MSTSLARRLFAEYLGTALLVTAVVGSGIMASRLSPNDIGIELLENSVATDARPVRAHPRASGRYREHTSTRSSPSPTGGYTADCPQWTSPDTLPPK
jgi:hypothetical protein